MKQFTRSVLSEKHITALSVLMAVQAFRSREAEASVVVNNPGMVHVYDTNKSPNERIEILDDPDRGELLVDQRTGEIKYFPFHEGSQDSFEYELVSDGMCTDNFFCPGLLFILGAVGGGIALIDRDDDPRPVQQIDWGDAPDSFQTVEASNGASHAIVPGVILGELREGDSNGQPTISADGDDTGDLTDDEDGITFKDLTSEFGKENVIDFSIGGEGSGYLSIWVDFNLNGEFEENEILEIEDGPEFYNYFVTAGDGADYGFRIQFPTEWEGDLPEPGEYMPVYLRARIANDEIVDLPYGSLSSGEVEDYKLKLLVNYDFGDLPEELDDGGEKLVLNAENLEGYGGDFLTRLENGGAGHLLHNTLFLGDVVDADPEGLPTELADGDDIIDGNDDDDGVIFYSYLEYEEDGDYIDDYLNPFDVNYVEINVGGEGDGYLNGWVDLDGDGEFSADEQIIQNYYVEADSSHDFDFYFDEDFLESGADHVYSRFRVSDQEIYSPNGLVIGGEVEDYHTPIVQLDYGDLPLGEGNDVDYDYGIASHIIVDDVYLGQFVDADPENNEPYDDYNTADGDDVGDGLDDEDGVWFEPLYDEYYDLTFEEYNGHDDDHGHFLVGGPGPYNNLISFQVGPEGGYVYGWIDMDFDGEFGEDELVVNTEDYALNPGMHYVPFYFEDDFDDSYPDYIYSRFRISQNEQFDPDPDGMWNSGEVEDFSTSWNFYYLGEA